MQWFPSVAGRNEKVWLECTAIVLPQTVTVFGGSLHPVDRWCRGRGVTDAESALLTAYSTIKQVHAQ